MDALYYVVISLFVVVCIMLVVIILLQSSQTGGMGSALAGNAFNAAFGGQGADKLLVRITSVLAVLFMSLAIGLNVLPTPGSQISNDGQMSTGFIESNLVPTPDNSIVPVEVINDSQESEEETENN